MHRKTATSVLLFFCTFAFGQIEQLSLDLPEVIALAQSDAPDVLIAKTRLSNRYWQFQSHLANYRPQINLNTNIPNLNRSIDRITIPDGTDIFVRRALMSNSIDIQVQQSIAATGGVIFASTGLERIDIFKTDLADASTSYLNAPVSINLIQPLFSFNELKWDQKIEPIRYQEATRAYAEEMEQVAFNAAAFFFDVFTEQLNVEAATREKANADTLYTIAQGRFEVGRIAETDLLQIELRARNADANLARAQLDLQTSTEELRNFLGINRQVAFELSAPTEIPTYTINAETALQYARKNRSENLEFQRQILEAERNLAQAKANSGPDVNLFASFGLTQRAEKLEDAFQGLLDREVVNLGIQVPLADWGKRQARLEIAQSNQELTNMLVEQDRTTFEREVLLKVQQFDLVRDQVALAQRAYEVALKRQDITQKRYLIGKVSLTDLNISIDEREAARRAYINALRNFWLAHYELRTLALYDFENDVSLVKTIRFGD